MRGSSTAKEMSILRPKLSSYDRYCCRRLRDLMANIFVTKHAIDNWRTALETTKSLLYSLKILWTLVHKWLKRNLRVHSPCINAAICILFSLR